MSTPKWPADHEEKHREAALKGWEGRRTASPFRRRAEDRAAKSPENPSSFSSSYNAALTEEKRLEKERNRTKNPGDRHMLTQKLGRARYLRQQMGARWRDESWTPFAQQFHDEFGEQPASQAAGSQARVSVRPHKYNGQDGFLISGHDAHNRKVSIFSRSQSEAERIRDDIKAGKEPQFDSERQREA